MPARRDDPPSFSEPRPAPRWTVDPDRAREYRDRALKQAMRTPYVVQRRVEPVKSVYQLMSFGHLEFREMQVDVHPHAYLGKVQGCSSWLSSGKSGFSSAAGIVPTFILEGKG